MARIALGSSMLATMPIAPPQWAQVVTSTPNTRSRRWGPGHRTALLPGRAIVRGRCGRCRIARRLPAATRRRPLHAPTGIRGGHPVKTRERARGRPQRGGFGDEVDRLEPDVRGVVAPRRLALAANPAKCRDRQPLLRNRRPRDGAARAMRAGACQIGKMGRAPGAQLGASSHAAGAAACAPGAPRVRGGAASITHAAPSRYSSGVGQMQTRLRSP